MPRESNESSLSETVRRGRTGEEKGRIPRDGSEKKGRRSRRADEREMKKEGTRRADVAVKTEASKGRRAREREKKEEPERLARASGGKKEETFACLRARAKEKQDGDEGGGGGAA